jgi:two-component system chemotaxis response regulator CheB
LLNDSSTVRAALQDSLSDCGYEAILARDGDEAWRIISQADAPHICILDWVMPGMTGVEICKKLRLLPEREYRYVLLLTSRGTKEEVIEGLEAGADDYLVKPISPPEIQARLRSAQRILQLQDGLTAECRTVLEEKQRIRLLLDSTAEGILGVDRTGRCTFCNRAALAEFGYDSESQILGKDIHSAAHHTRPDGTPCPTEECRFFSALFKEQPTHFTDDHYWHQDGTQFPVENWSYPIRGEDGVVGAVLTFWNTTDRRNAEDAQSTLKALEYGAVEIITKPRLGSKQFLEESQVMLCQAVKAAAQARIRPHSSHTVEPKLTADSVLSRATGAMIATTEKIVAIGASTGGTEALRVLLEALPPDAPGMVIVQHMPEMFTRAFAKRLDSLCGISVKEAEPNDTVLRGRALIAPGNHHMLLKRSGARYYVDIKDGPLVCRHRPSVDVLFRSAARYAGQNAVGVIMTGMGDDGANGMLEMKEAGAVTIAQDEETCVVFGMPHEAIKRDAVDEVLPLPAISRAILAHAN